MYKPGTQWSYSNINYMLLTKIVEKVSGQSFSQFVAKRIFEPLGMENSLVNDDMFQVIPKRAMGYNYRTEGETDWLTEDGYLRERGTGMLQIHRIMAAAAFIPPWQISKNGSLIFTRRYWAGKNFTT
ncbi:MAG: serine hydrolase domain-containing protein [Bacteroidota bacterium]